jgi:hypothetical protein
MHITGLGQRRTVADSWVEDHRWRRGEPGPTCLRSFRVCKITEIFSATLTLR